MIKAKSAAVAAAVLVSFLIAQPSSAQQAGRESSLVIGSLGGALDVVFRKAFKPFEESRNITIQWVPSVPAQTIAKVAATRDNPEFDVVLGDFITQQAGSNLNLFEKIDPAIVTNYKNVPQQLRLSGNNGVGFGTFYSGLFYRHVEFEKRGWAPPTSWDDLFRPEFCNNIGIPHPNVLFGTHTILMLGGGKLENASKGVERLSKLKNCMAVLEPSAPKLEEKIQLGEYLIGVHASIRAIPLIQRGTPIKFIMPKEGALLSITAASPVKNSRNPKLAQEFINWFISPETQAILIAEASFGPTNQTVKVPADLVALGVPDFTVYPKLLSTDVEALTAARRDIIRQTDRAMSN